MEKCFHRGTAALSLRMDKKSGYLDYRAVKLLRIHNPIHHIGLGFKHIDPVQRAGHHADRQRCRGNPAGNTVEAARNRIRKTRKDYRGVQERESLSTSAMAADSFGPNLERVEFHIR